MERKLDLSMIKVFYFVLCTVCFVYIECYSNIPEELEMRNNDNDYILIHVVCCSITCVVAQNSHDKFI